MYILFILLEKPLLQHFFLNFFNFITSFSSADIVVYFTSNYFKPDKSYSKHY